MVTYIAKNAASARAASFIPLVKQIDKSVAAPDLASLKPLTERVDLAIRQAGERDSYIAAVAKFQTEETVTPTLVSAPAPTASQVAVANPALPVASSSVAPFQLASTPKNRFLVEGELADLVLLFNSGRAPHVVKNLRGDIVFEGGIADACIFQTRGTADDSADAAKRVLRKQYGVEALNLDSNGCGAGRLASYDVIIAKRGTFLKQEATYSLSLVKEIETDQFKPLITLTEADVKGIDSAEKIKAAELVD